ncbi:MAG: DUF1824 family protein [Synechococcaceae cyanobacterium]|nr:DUF1824 family protein [Synechococcaceae cyanobacterium]
MDQTPSPAPAASASPASLLAGLRGLRSAPELAPAERQQLREELAQAMAPCRWFTVGVMADSAAAAVALLRRCEAAWGWPPLQPGDDDGTAGSPADDTVFLKGNQRSGHYLLRQEAGLGQGLLISGHDADDPGADDTWGPLPLDLFD